MADGGQGRGPADEIEIGIEIDPAASGLIVRSLDSTTERVQVGIVRLRRWPVHPIEAAPAVFDGHRAYLVKVNYQLELDLAPLRWFEFALSLVETQLGQATILDALPRTSSTPMPGAAHVQVNAGCRIVMRTGLLIGSAPLLDQIRRASQCGSSLRAAWSGRPRCGASFEGCLRR